MEQKIAAQESRFQNLLTATAGEDDVIDLISQSAAALQKSPPSVLPGSPISVASTPSHVGNGGSAPGFSQLSSGSHPSPPPPPFATMHWKPKEPPCFFGRSSEDVHTWTSLVRHYLTFMGGSDAQQVAYSVTLLRESAHEWYIGYERRHRNPPSDWAQLSNLLLERFGSNIRSQEAQSQLMSITQGQRLVRDYASQFETLLGRLDSYDESMMLNQFIWGLQPELARSVSLHYPKSIAQAVSLAETTELAVKASRRPATKTGSSGTGQKGPNTSNRAEESGVVERGVDETKEVEGIWEILVGEEEDQVEDNEENRDQPVGTHWHAIGAGCVAIWPVTVPKPTASREEEMQVLLQRNIFQIRAKRPTKRKR